MNIIRHFASRRRLAVALTVAVTAGGGCVAIFALTASSSLAVAAATNPACNPVTTVTIASGSVCGFVANNDRTTSESLRRSARRPAALGSAASSDAVDKHSSSYRIRKPVHSDIRSPTGQRELPVPERRPPERHIHEPPGPGAHPRGRIRRVLGTADRRRRLLAAGEQRA